MVRSSSAGNFILPHDFFFFDSHNIPFNNDKFSLNKPLLFGYNFAMINCWMLFNSNGFQSDPSASWNLDEFRNQVMMRLNKWHHISKEISHHYFVIIGNKFSSIPQTIFQNSNEEEIIVVWTTYAYQAHLWYFVNILPIQLQPNNWEWIRNAHFRCGVKFSSIEKTYNPCVNAHKIR